jgi:hypothetical protein
VTSYCCGGPPSPNNGKTTHVPASASTLYKSRARRQEIWDAQPFHIICGGCGWSTWCANKAAGKNVDRRLKRHRAKCPKTGLPYGPGKD